MRHYQRFSDVSVSEKILDTMFLLMIGLAYFFALLNTYYTHEGRDGESGLSVKDVMIAYNGAHGQTRLGAAIMGPMAGNFPSEKAKQDVLDWIARGSSEAGYETKVKPILDRNCIMCHSQESGMPVPSLETYNHVMELTQEDTGASIPTLVRVSHIHLFGIAFILFFVGRIFLLCEMPVLWKRVAVVIPFVAIIIDIMAWYVTKVIPDFAYVVVFAGGLMGLSLWLQILLSGYQMWFLKSKVKGEGNE
ncbi:MAG: hypothetical protein Q9M75_05360 [Ghiorsea sp.]|nr:hypothetical protein [Ghiorsea sp.]